MAVQAQSKRPLVRGIALSFVLISASAMIMPLAASAQFAQPLQEPPTQNGGVPFPPPIGSGPTPKGEITGDTTIGAPPNVPTGVANTGPTTPFPQGTGNDRSEVFIYTQGGSNPTANNNRGQRMSMTIRPDQLSSQELAQISGILGINMEQGLQTVDVTATPAQVAQIQGILAPYPQTQNNGGKQVINSDSPNAAYPKPGEESSYNFQGPLPTVRTFSRYLVILGVVCATVFMALAGYPTPGDGTALRRRPCHRHCSRLHDAAMRLHNLEDRTNEHIRRHEQSAADQSNRPTQATVNAGNLAPSTVPGIPNAPGGRPDRSGIPVAPLAGVPGN